VTSRLEVSAWRRVITVNLDGTFHILRAALRAMRPAGRGAIATPEEIADIAVFLAGDQAGNLVGAVLLANVGRFTR
jgi:NAD(P)-dependent dehydrogenase (short-subunit alcohol dehydrogenase family)